MDYYTDAIRALPDDEKLLLVQRIWDDLAGSGSLPVPEWAITEANRRKSEMIADPRLGMTHEEVTRRIADWRNG